MENNERIGCHQRRVFVFDADWAARQEEERKFANNNQHTDPISVVHQLRQPATSA